jgi:hypothetical protein
VVEGVRVGPTLSRESDDQAVMLDTTGESFKGGGRSLGCGGALCEGEGSNGGKGGAMEAKGLGRGRGLGAHVMMPTKRPSEDPRESATLLD